MSTLYLLMAVAMGTMVNGGIPMARYEALLKSQSQSELGLYNSTDKVRILTNINFKDEVLQRNRSALVEFYNSYCGHCKRFAPHYKELAEKLYPWRDILPVCAIDCAAEENNDICREYEVMAYPTLRYFGPGYLPEPENYGRSIETQDLNDIRAALAQHLAAENRTANMSTWPNLHPLSSSEESSLFEGLSSLRKFVVVVYEPENSTIGIETILRFYRWPDVQIRRVTDPDTAAKLQIDGIKYKIVTVDRKGNTIPYQPLGLTSDAYVDTIESILREKHFTEAPEVTKRPLESKPVHDENHDGDHILISEVLRNKHLVYQADLEMAIRGVLYNEVPKIADISGERLLALQRFMNVLHRYNPLGVNGRKMVQKLNSFVMQFNQHLNGKEFEKEVMRLNVELKPIFTTNRYVGCAASKPGLRGYTCSLWQLFHFFTVQAAQNELSQDPLEVLQAMHGYIKGFFGCTECAEHFQAMAARRKIWSTPNKDEAILWLWAAHNEVNQRLAGDSTEDPKFPKIQFPSQSSCNECYRQPIMSPANLDISWDKDAVLSFMKNIHNPAYINRLGVENDKQLFPTVEQLRQKRMIGNVFSDMDMRMGMLLYGFCIVMMVVAFKLFAFKGGYRKKMYGHDMLGKV